MAETDRPGLHGSASPFLRHGAEQPVEWMPWGDAAFRRARQEDRPILLDIGAVWCHWCHVMDRESYEDPATAALINDRFVPVKVDRDERPDVDSRYQRAVQVLSGQGGWPLTAFLTPKGEAFYGGTYFPPTDAHGRPSFTRVLNEIDRVWREEREKVEHSAASVTGGLQEIARGEARPGELGPELVEDAVDAIARTFDERFGGFGRAPKFPNAGAVGLLLDIRLDEGDEAAGRMARGALEAMAAGGVYDQLGGGFHRYSTDARWLIPHFEKMAYDNGVLLEACARAARPLDSPLLQEAAAGVVRYYREEAPDLWRDGGFPASQDADIGPDDDGDYWTWTIAEMEAAIGDDTTMEAARLRWGLSDPEATMHLDPSRHVLFQAMSVEEVAGRIGRDRAETEPLLDQAGAALLEARRQRPRPYVDDTLYGGWVALVASGHIAAARHLGMQDAGRAALRALERVWAEGWRPERGLLHRIGDDASGFHLADQAYAAAAFLDAFEWTQDREWLERTNAVTEVMRDRFTHPSGAFQDTPVDADAEVALLEEGRVDITDSPEPSPNAVAAMVLVRLSALGQDQDAATAAAGVLRAFAGTAPRFAPNAATYFRALRWVLGPVTTVVVVEEAQGPLVRAALETYRPRTVLLAFDPGAVDPAGVPPEVAAMLTGEAPRAYVCAGRTCAAPVSSAADLKRLLRELGS